LYKNVLVEVQDRLFTVGAILATPPEKETLKNGQPRLNINRISDDDIDFLEKEIDLMDTALPPMTHFVLPGGHTTVSYCHIARCVCRRAERLAVHLHELEPTDEQVIKYLNRLSDYLFVLARKLSFDLQAEEVKWIPRK
jgi:cob(I)alamin adenosyltransferase